MILFAIRPRPSREGFTLSSESLSFPMWYGTVRHAIGYARFRAGSQLARIEVLDTTGATVETIEHDPAHRENAQTIGGM